MKKSVIVLIGVIYVLAIAIVSFFGLKPDYFGENIYVEKIELKEGTYKTAIDGTKYIVTTYETDPGAITVVQLEWHVYPDEASRKIVKFIYDEENAVATVDAFGKVIFNKKGAITVIIATTDGSSKNETVKVIAK